MLLNAADPRQTAAHFLEGLSILDFGMRVALPGLQKTSIFLSAAAITSVFFINFCATVFHCGCSGLWSGADAHCNIHTPGIRHCPWCAGSLTASIIPYAGILAAQAAISFSRRQMPFGVRLLASAAAFPIVGGLAAVAAGLLNGYWR